MKVLASLSARQSLTIASAFVAVAMLFGSQLAAAQQPRETIAGTVVDSNRRVIAGAQVMVTRGPDRLTRAITADSAGVFQVTFDGGSGDYLLFVSAVGHQSFRRRLTRMGDAMTRRDTTWVVNVVLAARAQLLAVRRVKASVDIPARGLSNQPDVGGDALSASGIGAATSPVEQGSLDAVLAGIPGVTNTGGGSNLLGLASSQNLTTLNGMTFEGAGVPRDAQVRVRVATSTYDPGRGGFSGGETTLELAPGGEYTQMRSHVTAQSPSRVSGEGTTYDRTIGAVVLSYGADGPLGASPFVMNGAMQLSHTSQSIRSVSENRTDVSNEFRDSIQALVLALKSLHALSPQSALAPQRTSAAFSAILRLDHAPRDLISGNAAKSTWGLTGFLEHHSDAGLGISALNFSTSAFQTTRDVGMVSALLSTYAGTALTETRVATTVLSQNVGALQHAPTGRVLINYGIEGADAVVFGGSPASSSTHSAVVQATTSTSWAPIRSVHRFRSTLEGQLEAVSDADAYDANGTFEFLSISDLARGKPSSYTRTLAGDRTTASAWSGATSFADYWRPTQSLQFLYGARLEAQGLTAPIPRNEAVTLAFGVANDAVLGGIYLSPRFGFSWAYGGANARPPSDAASNLGRLQNAARGILRGGIGDFRGRVNPRRLSAAARNSGNSSRATTIRCLGVDAPSPIWDLSGQDADMTIGCMDALPGTLSSSEQPIRFFDKTYSASHSVRANLAWSGAIGPISVGIEGVYSRNLRQPSYVDLNFGGMTELALADEKGRPIYVRLSGIDTTTGLVNAALGRRLPVFGAVEQQMSDMASTSRQLSVTLAPLVQNLADQTLSVNYTYLYAIAEQRGFSATTSGDPRQTEKFLSPLAARHQITFLAGTTVGRRTIVTFASRFFSGLPYTPVVSSDINGDGRLNDRAFIFDPQHIRTVDPQLADQLSGLLSRSEGRCLRDYQEQLAAAQSCRGPWFSSSNLRVKFLGGPTLVGHRLRWELNVSNPIAAVDRIVNASSGSRWWGTSFDVNSTLYQVAGFDNRRHAFKYSVNREFGQVIQGEVRNPFQVSLDVSISLGTPPAEQMLKRTVVVGRGRDTRPRPTVEALRARYARTVLDVFAAVLQESDSLLLSSSQVDSLVTAQTHYRSRVNEVWMSLARYLYELPDEFSTSEALIRTNASTEEAWAIVKEESDVIRRVLSPLQIALLSPLVKEILVTKGKITIRIY